MFFNVVQLSSAYNNMWIQCLSKNYTHTLFHLYFTVNNPYYLTREVVEAQDRSAVFLSQYRGVGAPPHSSATMIL